jgi:gluconate kinase
MPNLVIIRGPAGSGKSTISSAVLNAMRAAKVDTCYLEQDLFRNTLLGGGPNAAEVSASMLHSATVSALEGGYSVLLEGILNCNPVGGKFKALIEGLVALPSSASTSSDALKSIKVSLVYLNPSLEVTKSRHTKRAKAAVFGAELLDKWWSSSNATGLPGEIIMDTSEQSLEETVAAVMAHIGVEVEVASSDGNEESSGENRSGSGKRSRK